MTARGKWIGALAVVTVLLGTGRLAMDEVSLAGSEARTRGLEQRADGAARDRYRLVRLEQELVTERKRIAELDAQLTSEADQVAALSSSVAASREELQQLRTTSELQSGQYEQALLEANEKLQRGEKKLSELEGTVQARTRELAAAKSQAQERERELAAAQTLANERAQSLARSRSEAREQAQKLEGQRQELARLKGGLQSAVDRAERSEDVLSRLESAGVNVDRLSGQRPMPRIAAVVVRVDAEAVPPTLMIDVGRASGIEVRDILYLIRDGGVVATLEVSEVGEQVSSAKVIEGQRGLKLRPGEDVTSVRPAVTPP